MIFEPFISPTLWITLAVLTAALLAWYWLRRPSVMSRARWFVCMASMTGALVGVLLLLLNPSWLEPVLPPAGKPVLTVLLDRSSSMAADDLAAGKTRYEAAAEFAQRLPSELSSKFDVQLKTFDSRSSPSSADEIRTNAPAGAMSDLEAAITSAIAEERPQGQAVLMLSDGIHNGPGGIEPLLRAAQHAKTRAVPIYTTTFGTDKQFQDIEVSLPRAQELAFAGQRVRVNVDIRQRGKLADRTTIRLLENEQEVSTQAVGLSRDGASTANFELKKDKGGLYRYEIRSEPIAGEVTAANNSAILLVRVLDKPVHVLLLEGKPYWDGKFLLRTLAADPALQLDSVVRLKEGRFLKRALHRLDADSGDDKDQPKADAVDTSQITDGTMAKDVTSVARVQQTTVLSSVEAVLQGPGGLEQYQLVILGRDAEVFLTDSALDRLRTWISREGGSLICYRGQPVAQPSQRLARLLPVRWSDSREARFRLELTDRGQDLGWLSPTSRSEDQMLDKMPSIASGASQVQPAPLAVVLARSAESGGPPALTYQPYGTGRVVTIEGAGMWRWAFLSPQYDQHSAVYASLWQSLLRWLISSAGLTPGQDMVLRMDRVTWLTGESVVANLLVREEKTQDNLPVIQLTGEGLEASQQFTPTPVGDEPGVYQINFGQLREGDYEASLGNKAADSNGSEVGFSVRPYLGEQLDLAARPDIMARVSRDSGGTVVEAGEPDAIAKAFEEHNARSRPQRVRRITVWDRWWVLMGIVALWGTAWTLRRSSGLV